MGMTVAYTDGFNHYLAHTTPGDRRHDPGTAFRGWSHDGQRAGRSRPPRRAAAHGPDRADPSNDRWSAAFPERRRTALAGDPTGQPSGPGRWPAPMSASKDAALVRDARDLARRLLRRQRPER